MEEFIIENFLLILILCGPIFIIAGMITLKFPPKEINHLYGYRTKNSMKNQEQWDFAQEKSSWEMMKIGFLMILFSFLPFLIELNPQQNVFIGLFFLFLSCIVLFFRVENAIKRKFGQNKTP